VELMVTLSTSTLKLWIVNDIHFIGFVIGIALTVASVPAVIIIFVVNFVADKMLSLWRSWSLSWDRNQRKCFICRHSDALMWVFEKHRRLFLSYREVGNASSALEPLTDPEYHCTGILKIFDKISPNSWFANCV
jgi:hypothetical protein